jgi:polysaccharide export outer membrane protein
MARTASTADTNYPIGPGDVLQISAQYVPELRNRIVRVAGDGSCDLPLIGHVQAGGLSEGALTNQIAKRLRKYIYNPEVTVFVSQYRSHQVAVVGAVKNPGLMTLSGSQETVLDMLKRAGGATPDAGDAIILFPTTEAGNASQDAPKVMRITNPPSSPDENIDGNTGASRDDAEPPSAPQNLRPLIIPLHTTSLTYSSISLPSAGNFLQMPVRPGDLILVPGGGEVMVIGWVKTPGHFKVNAGMTVLEAIAAAGGPQYIGDDSDVQVIRTDPSGAKRVIPVNIAAVKKGQAEDPPVFPNDVINVPYSKAKVGPYLLYGLLSRIGIGFGGAVPIP